MPTRNFTISDRINIKLNSNAIEYLDAYCAVYSKVERRMWHDMTSKDFEERYSGRSAYVSHIMREFNLLKRTVNSMYNEISGRMTAYMELKVTEANQLSNKITKKQAKINKLKEQLDKLKPLAAANQLNEKQLVKYRSNKHSLHHQQAKLNNMQQKLDNLYRQIENEEYSFCFGGKKQFRKQYFLEENGYTSHAKWLEDFRRCRDKNVFYLGSSDESGGNQMCTMSYDHVNKTFTVRIRKEHDFCEDGCKYVILSGIKFPYMHDELVNAVMAYQSRNQYDRKPLSFRFRRDGKKWYMQCIFAIEFDDYDTRRSEGIIGLDYNDGFIQMSEVDKHGNLIAIKRYNLSMHGTGDAAESEIREAVAKIVSYAALRGKDIAIENLKFTTTKAMCLKAKLSKGKAYNKMIHAFDYHRYVTCMENATHKKRVCLVKANPAYTSKIGAQKYAVNMKLNIHTAAAFVIARRGLGFIDKNKKPTRKRKKQTA